MSRGPQILDGFVEGDLLPNLSIKWESQDITGFTFSLHFRKPNGTRVTKAGIIDEANVGGLGTAIFHFEWAAGDLVTGDSDAEIEVTDVSSKNETFPRFILRVTEEIS